MWKWYDITLIDTDTICSTLPRTDTGIETPSVNFCKIKNKKNKKSGREVVKNKLGWDKVEKEVVKNIVIILFEECEAEKEEKFKKYVS